MDYGIGYVSSFILTPKYILDLILRPMNLIERSFSSEDRWDSNYPTSEFIALVTVTVFTLASYSAISIGLVEPGATAILTYFDIETPYASAAFFGLLAPLAISLPCALFWLVLSRADFSRKNAETAGRIAMSITLLVGISEALNILLTVFDLELAKIYDPSGDHQPLIVPTWIRTLIDCASDIFRLSAIAYFFVSLWKFRHLKPLKVA